MLRAEATIYVRKNNVLCRQVIAHIVKSCLDFLIIKIDFFVGTVIPKVVQFLGLR